VAGCCEGSDESSSSSTAEIVNLVLAQICINSLVFFFHKFINMRVTPFAPNSLIGHIPY
jgi:hypothetical protein